MTFKTRRILFYGLFLLFTISGLGLVFYSQGWRINTENCQIKFLNCPIKFQKIGAIFIETKPKGVVIKINGEVFPDKSGLIQSGTLITNLLPQNYKVEIEKEGYRLWQKNIRVEPSLVSEILKVVLIPEKFEKELISIAKPIKDFQINPQQKIVFNSDGTFYYLKESATAKLRGDEFIEWSGDGDKIILKNSKNQNYYLYDLANLSKTLNINVVFNNLEKKSVITKITFHPADSNRLIIQSKNDLYLLDLARLKSENLLKESLTDQKTELLAWTTKNPNIYYIKQTQNLKLPEAGKTQNYYLASFNLTVKTENFSAKLPDYFSPDISGELKISVSGSKIAILTNKGNLYIFNQENQGLAQIAHSAKSFVFSPDRKKIAFFDKDGKLNVYFLEDYQMGINKKANEIISLSIYAEKGISQIKNIFWYEDSHHLIVEYLGPEPGRRIDFIEIDNRSTINRYPIIENADKFFYELESNRFYFIEKNNLYFFEI